MTVGSQEVVIVAICPCCPGRLQSAVDNTKIVENDMKDQNSLKCVEDAKLM